MQEAQQLKRSTHFSSAKLNLAVLLLELAPDVDRVLAPGVLGDLSNPHCTSMAMTSASTC